MTQTPKLVSLALLRTLSFALFVLLAGCGDNPGDHSGNGASLSVRVGFARSLTGSNDIYDTDLNRSLAVRVFDVTADPLIRNEEVESGNLLPVLDDTTAVTVETGGFLFEKMFAIDAGEEPRDFRVRVKMLSGLTVLPPVGWRTVNDLIDGEEAEIDIYLAPGDAPHADDYGLQLASSFTSADRESHLLPVVLMNGSDIGGFQFDFVYSPAQIDTIDGFIIDDASRLYVDAPDRVTATVASNRIGPSRLRVLVYTGDESGFIAPGYDVIFYLDAAVADSASSDSIRIENVVFSTTGGDTLDGGLTMNAFLEVR